MIAGYVPAIKLYGCRKDKASGEDRRMKRKLTALLCAFALTCGTVSGAALTVSAEEESSVVVTMTTSSEPTAGFDPVYGWGAGEHVHEPLIQSTLLVTNTDLSIGMDLATEYASSEDGLTWTVKIRDDVSFTDGEALTASDVAFTYNTCKENSSVNDFTMLDYAEAVDDTTVVFHMTKAFSPWPYTMAITGIVPEHAYDESYGMNPIGSGRYILKQWDQGQQVILEANPDYYGDEIKIKKVTVLFMDEEASLAAAMAGQVDVAYTASTFAEMLPDGYELLEVASVDNRGVSLPSISAREIDGLTVGNDVLSDVAVRRAINIGIDREKMIEHVLGGYGTPAYSVCDQMPWYNEASEVAYDPEGAAAILDEAGWVMGDDGIREKDGQACAFTLMYHPSDSVRQALAEDMANQLRELGIDVTTEGAGWDVAYDKAQSQALVWGWGAHSPMELYNMYHTAPGSEYAEYSPYANETVDQYMDAALAASDLDEAYELWQKAQYDGTTGVTQDGDIPWIWLCNVSHLYFVKDGLEVAGQKIHPHGHGWSLVNNVDQWEWAE